MQLPLFLTALVCTLGSHLELHWLNPPRKILVVAKPSPDVLRSLVRVAAWLLDPLRAMHVYVEPSVYARLGLVSAHPFCMQYCSLCNAEYKLQMCLMHQTAYHTAASKELKIVRTQSSLSYVCNAHRFLRSCQAGNVT